MGNTFEHDTTNALDSSMVQISESHYLLAYGSSDSSKGKIKVIYVNPATYITSQVGSTLDHNSESSSNNCLIKMKDNYYALTYFSFGAQINVVAYFYVNPSTYAISEMDSLAFDDGYSAYDDYNESAHMTRIDDDYALISYSAIYEDASHEYGLEGRLSVININYSTTSITVHDSDEYHHNTTYSNQHNYYTHSLIKLTDAKYIVTYIDNMGTSTATDDELLTKLIQIDGSHNISSVGNDVFIKSGATSPTTLTIDDTHWMVIYNSNYLTLGSIRIFSLIGTTPTLVGTASSLGTVHTLCSFSVIALLGNYFMVSYRNTGGYSAVRTFQVNTSYIIVSTSSETEYTGTAGANNFGNSLVLMNDKHYVLASTGTGYDGYVRLISTNGFASHMKIQVGDVWEDVTSIKIQVGNVWKDVTEAIVNLTGATSYWQLSSVYYP